jgi:hypothetical protein
MNKCNSIFVVDTRYERYEDFHAWNEVAFRELKDAEAYAKQIDDNRPTTPAIEDDLWSKAERAWFDENDSKFGSDWDINPYSREDQLSAYEQWEVELHEREVKFCFDFVNANGSRHYTLVEARQQANYDNHRMNEWAKCVIKEIQVR